MVAHGDSLQLSVLLIVELEYVIRQDELERSLKFGFERFWRDFNLIFFFVAKDFVRPWAVKEN